jgi:hypothetical protein
MTPIRIGTVLTMAVSLIAPAVSVAGDGVLEINQTCAVSTGCFPGDTPGLPVQITQPGSYGLTSDLNLPDVPESGGIELLADEVTIDFRGFAIRGSLTCLPGDCTAGLPFGISPPLLGGGGERTTVRNGMIIGIPGLCLGLREKAHVESMLIAHCGGNGVVVGDQSLVVKNRVANIGQTGISVAQGGRSAASDNVIALTGLRLVESPNVKGVTATGGNLCDDGSCAPDGQRLYYLTADTYNGAQARDACDAGFHMASMWEILDPTDLRYETIRGSTGQDAGSGPPSGQPGWIRTGNPGLVVVGAPGGNSCDGYSSTSGSGTTVALPVTWEGDANSWVPWWNPTLSLCGTSSRVWCIQD